VIKLQEKIVFEMSLVGYLVFIITSLLFSLCFFIHESLWDC